ncbi:hypothetical protein BpHYR1_028715 [Brachionus plicatilis]|uniref:SWIM-type domain-containing protein n=1 Tax=Brachionus plicatilis TaxID=10195 RepID=A0A3M7Q534_BRAPC|nr:hypothetical protein BpHYR1_028715 [Brachionus plicatilis]
MNLRTKFYCVLQDIIQSRIVLFIPNLSRVPKLRAKISWKFLINITDKMCNCKYFRKDAICGHLLGLNSLLNNDNFHTFKCVRKMCFCMCGKNVRPYYKSKNFYFKKTT